MTRGIRAVLCRTFMEVFTVEGGGVRGRRSEAGESRFAIATEVSVGQASFCL